MFLEVVQIEGLNTESNRPSWVPHSSTGSCSLKNAPNSDYNSLDRRGSDASWHNGQPRAEAS